MRELGGRLKEQETELARVEEARDELPRRCRISRTRTRRTGKPDEDAVTLREVGERREFDFAIRDHLDLGVGQRLD